MQQDRYPMFVEGEGRITIGRVTSTSGPDFMSIELDDALNHVRLVEVRVSLEEFVEALMGGGYRKCEFSFHSNPPLGKRLETKTEEVSIPYFDFKRDDRARVAAVRAAVSLYEVDGWQGEDRDMSNHHNLIRLDRDAKVEHYRVHFRRYVEQEV